MTLKNSTYIQAVTHVLKDIKKDSLRLNNGFSRLCAKAGLGESGTKKLKHALSLAVLGGGVLAGAVFGPAMIATQLLGLAGMAIILKGMTFEDNRHKRAASSLGGTLNTAQMGLLGAWGGMLQGGLATSRAFTMAAVPDHMRKTRAGLTLAFGAVAAGVFCQLPPSPYNIMPLATMVCGTAGDFFPSSMSRHTRATWLLGNVAMVPYHMLVSRSLGALGATFGVVALLYKTARSYDMPVRTRDGAEIGPIGQHTRWLKSLFNARSLDGFSRAEWVKKAPKPAALGG